MRILVLGAGGIGGLFGGRLAQSGADVTFLVRQRRAEQLAREGLVIDSPHGNATVAVRTVQAGAVQGSFDLVILSCKAYDLDDAIEAIRPALSASTVVLPLLNGLAHMDRLDDAFGRDRVLGGLAHIVATLTPAGHVKQMGKLGVLTVGAREAHQHASCDQLMGLAEPALFDAKASRDVLQDMWEKFAFITAAAAATCLMRSAIGPILASEGGREVVLEILNECEAVAAASNHAIRERARDWARGLLLQDGSSFTSSMLRDLRHGARVEADHLVGDMIAKGAKADVGVPLLRLALTHLHAYEAGRAAA